MNENLILKYFKPSSDTEIAIAKIDTLNQGADHVKLKVSGSKSEERMNQLRASHVLVNELVQPNISIQRSRRGKPKLVGHEANISISHTDNYMSMILGRNEGIAIDIELLERDASRFATRYTNPEEQKMVANTGLINPLIHIWGVKECLFKSIDQEGVLFKEHLIIERVEQTESNLFVSQCWVKHPKTTCIINVNTRIFEPLIVSYITETTD